MDARELTMVVEKMKNDVREDKKRIDYLEMELEKIRLLMNVMKIDVEMLQRERMKG